MEFYAQVNQRKLITLYDSDHEKVGKLKKDTLYKFKASAPRNEKFHCKFFALLNLGFQNQDFQSDFDDYRDVLIMRSGFYKTIPTSKGVIYKAPSLSFGSMDQEEFENIFNALLVTLGKDLHSSSEEILAELYSFM